MHAITAQVEDISATTMHERVPVPPTDDEIAELATVMNGMLDRLEAGSARQRQFVSDASHELRSPLATIRAATEVGAPGATEDVLAECDRMDQLIGDLLDLARLEEHREDVGRETVEVAELVRSVCARARNGGPDVSVDAPGPAPVTGSRRQLDRVVRNLVDNACAHAAAAVAVAVATEPTTGAVALVVSDDGPGIPEAQRQRVFDRFVRLDESRARGDGGTGLGLAIVAAVVERHGGTVAFTDPDGLGGARVEVRLPGGRSGSGGATRPARPGR